MKGIVLALAAAVALAGCAKTEKLEYRAEVPLAAVSADQSLARLKVGNARFAAGADTFRGLKPEQIALHDKGQRPSAILLSCADSRVPVEHIFDTGVGELFVLRVAGNIATPENLGSMEFATVALGAPLIVVMGHSQCGAVIGAQGVQYGSKAYPAELQALLENLSSDLEAEGAKAADVNAAIEANVRQQMDRVLANEAIAEAVKTGKVKVVGAVYETGTPNVLQ